MDEAHIFQTRDPNTGREEHFVSFVAPDVAFERSLPSEAIIGKLLNGPDFFDADHFIPNGRFIQFLHEVIARYAAECPDLVAAAKRQRDGYVYIIDGRTPAPDAGAPPEDIVGAVEVRAGAVGGYEGNPNYKVFTASGLMALDEWFRRKVSEELERIMVEST